MRERVAALGIPSEIQRSGPDEITVALADAGNLAPRGEQVGKTAQLDFYDWEPNVIGSAGKPAPTERTVTGGPNAGAAQFGLTEYQAVLRAAKRAAIIRSSDTTLEASCTPAQIGGCRYGVWYLLDTKHEKVLRGPEESDHSFYETGYTPPADAVVKAVHVNPGTVLVQARPLENAAGKVINASPNSWYVLNDNPVLNGEDINNPRQGLFNPQQGCCLYEGEGTGQPDVVFGFTSHGKTVFERITKEIVHRGQEAQLPGVTKEEALQHFAIVLDNQIITAPSIDYTQYPEGIDASNGSEISGGFTISSARSLANELRFGALPIKLTLIDSPSDENPSSSRTSASTKPALVQGAAVSSDHRYARCRAADIAVSLTEPISAMTGEHARYFALTNDSREACVIDGFPRVELYHGSHRLPFIYHYGHGMYLGVHEPSRLRPARVLLRPHATAEFLVAKFRCESRRGAEASELRFTLPGQSTPLHLSLPAGGGGYGVSALDYCFNGHDWPPHLGNEIEVSAIFSERG